MEYKPSLFDVVCELMRQEHLFIEFNGTYLYSKDYKGDFYNNYDVDRNLDKAHFEVYGVSYKDYRWQEAREMLERMQAPAEQPKTPPKIVSKCSRLSDGIFNIVSWTKRFNAKNIESVNEAG